MEYNGFKIHKTKEEKVMKKITALILTGLLALSCVGCGGNTADADVKSEGVMTYDEYVAAALDSEVVVETYVQAKQSWWEDKATVYTQDKAVASTASAT